MKTTETCEKKWKEQLKKTFYFLFYNHHENVTLTLVVLDY